MECSLCDETRIARVSSASHCRWGIGVGEIDGFLAREGQGNGRERGGAFHVRGQRKNHRVSLLCTSICRWTVRGSRASYPLVSILSRAFPIRRVDGTLRVVAINIPCSLPGYCTWDWNWPRCRCDPLDYSPPGDCILITRHQARVKTIVQGLRSRASRDGWRSHVLFLLNRVNTREKLTDQARWFKIGGAIANGYGCGNGRN